LRLPKNGVKPKCRQNQKTDAVALTKHYRALLLGIIPGRLSCFDAPNSSDHCFSMCGSPEARGTWGLTKAFVSFGLQKKFIQPTGTDGPFPAIEGGKDYQGGLLFDTDNNLGFERQNRDYLLFPILTGQH
jgi:hypothetical protein